MATTRTLRGRVFDKTNQTRYSNTTIKLEPVKGLNGQTAFIETDRNGEYQFDLSDESAFPEGNYTLSAYHADAVMELDEPIIAVPMPQGKGFSNIPMLSRDQFSQSSGIGFGAFLVILLLAVSGYYSYWHLKHPVPLDLQIENLVLMLETYQLDKQKNGGQPSSKEAAAAIRQPALDSTATQTDSTASPPPTLARTAQASEPFLLNTLDTMSAIASSVLIREKLDSTDFGKAFIFLIDEARRATLRGNDAELDLLLQEIKLQSSKRPNNFFWDTYPLRMLEVLLWALIATLLRLIVNTGYYLFRKRFIKSGIYHSLGLIFTVPILALLISIVLSFIKINLALGEAELNLDLTNIYISILVATFIGLSPWKAWDYLNGLSDSLFKRLKA